MTVKTLVQAAEATAVERQEQIRRAALACFTRKGYYRTTMDDIVAQSGLSKGTLYWYFKSKKDLFISLFQVTMEGFGRAWELIVADASLSARDKLAATFCLYRSQLEGFVPLLGLMVEAWALTRHDEDMEEITRELYAPYLRLMERIIEEGVASGEFSAQAPHAAATVVAILLDGITLAMGIGVWERDWGNLVDAAAALVLRGLEASPDAAR